MAKISAATDFIRRLGEPSSERQGAWCPSVACRGNEDVANSLIASSRKERMLEYKDARGDNHVG
jgi:hypothetical protein